MHRSWISGWIDSLLQRDSSAVAPSLVALLTPTAARERSRLTQLVLATTTAGALLTAGVIATTALAALLFALALIYFLTTEVLGLTIDLDPEALHRSMRRPGRYAN